MKNWKSLWQKRRPDKKRRILAVFLAGLLFLPVMGCAGWQAIPTETTPPATLPVTNPPGLAQEEPIARWPVWSQSLFVKGGYAYFTHPVSHFLMRYSIAEKTGEILLSRPVYESFFLAGDRLFVRSEKDGFLYSMNTEGEELTKLFALPFEKGLLLGDVLFLLGHTLEDNTVLYRYEPKNARWSMHILQGSHNALAGGTVVFGNDAVYYVQEEEGREAVVARALETGQKTVVYRARMPGGGQLHSLCWREGSLFLADEGTGICAVDAEGTATLLQAKGDRVLAPLADGVLFGNSAVASDAIFYGNKEGQEVEFSAGVVWAGYGARAIVSRRDAAGRERISLVKYPEDDEQALMEGSLAMLKVGQQHALAIFYDRDEYCLFNMAAGSALALEGRRAEAEEVSVRAYLDEEESGRSPLGEEIALAPPVKIARLFATALCRNDRYTMERLSVGAASLPLCYPCHAEGFRLFQKEKTERRDVFSVELVRYKNDKGTYWPPWVQAGTLTVMQTANGWRVERPAD